MKYASLPGLNSYLAMKTMIRYFGHDFVEMPDINEEMLSWGSAQSPEYACLPFKIYLGFFRKLTEQKIDRVFIYGSRDRRACRYLDLCNGIAQILRDHGLTKMDVHFWGGYGLWQGLVDFKKAMGNPSWLKVINGIIIHGSTLTAVDELNDLANWARPRETVKGSVDVWLKKWWQIMGESLSRRKIKEALILAKSEFALIKLDDSRPIIKVALIGDLFKIHEPFFHFDTIRKLNKMGVEVKQSQAFSLLFFGTTNLPSRAHYRELYAAYRQKAQKYLKSVPASCIDISVGETIDQLEQGAKGIVHFQSFGCMPDIMLKPILDRVAKDFKVPIIHYLRDVHSSDGAYQTRLEAFVDLIKRKGKI
ncbi:MAG: hypothetical protein WC518_01720 [Patescibacteria group bacterium]